MSRKAGLSYNQIRIMCGSWWAKNPDITLKDLKEMSGVSEPTLIKWKREDEWDEERQLYQKTPLAIERSLLKEMQNISEGGEPTIKADALSKVKNALALIQRDVNPQITFAVLQKLDNFIASHYPDLLNERLEIHKEFLRDVVENYNDQGASKVIFISK